MFCRGDEVLPLPPADETLEVATGTTLLFDYGGRDRLRVRDQGMAPSLPPIYVGGLQLGEQLKTRAGPDGLRVIKNKPEPGRFFEQFEVRRTGKDLDNRFFADRALVSGEYVIHFQVRMPEREADYYFRVRVTHEGSSRSP
jgi:hypothetical protein